MNATLAHLASVLVGETWRPWKVDALATVITANRTTITIQYDHSPTRYSLSPSEFHGGMDVAGVDVPIEVKLGRDSASIGMRGDAVERFLAVVKDAAQRIEAIRP